MRFINALCLYAGTAAAAGIQLDLSNAGEYPTGSKSCYSASWLVAPVMPRTSPLRLADLGL